MSKRPNVPLSGAQYRERNLQPAQRVSATVGIADQREWLELIGHYEVDFDEFVAEREARLEEMAKLTSNKLKEVKTDEELAALMYQMASQITSKSLEEDVETAKHTVSIRSDDLIP